MKTRVVWTPEISTPNVVKSRKKLTKIRYMHALKLNFIALNDCSWSNCHGRCEKIVKPITLCENRFDTRISYPSPGLPTPLPAKGERSISVYLLSVIQLYPTLVWEDKLPLNEQALCTQHGHLYRC